MKLPFQMKTKVPTPKKPKRNLSALTVRRLRAIKAAVLKEPELYDLVP